MKHYSVYSELSFILGQKTTTPKAFVSRFSGDGGMWDGARNYGGLNPSGT